MVKRYTLGRSPAYGLENNIREFDMVESAHGEYVGLHDYRAVAERCERLEADLAKCHELSKLYLDAKDHWRDKYLAKDDQCEKMEDAIASVKVEIAMAAAHNEISVRSDVIAGCLSGINGETP